MDECMVEFHSFRCLQGTCMISTLGVRLRNFCLWCRHAKRDPHLLHQRPIPRNLSKQSAKLERSKPGMDSAFKIVLTIICCADVCHNSKNLS